MPCNLDRALAVSHGVDHIALAVSHGVDDVARAALVLVALGWTRTAAASSSVERAAKVQPCRVCQLASAAARAATSAAACASNDDAAAFNQGRGGAVASPLTRHDCVHRLIIAINNAFVSAEAKPPWRRCSSTHTSLSPTSSPSTSSLGPCCPAGATNASANRSSAVGRGSVASAASNAASRSAARGGGRRNRVSNGLSSAGAAQARRHVHRPPPSSRLRCAQCHHFSAAVVRRAGTAIRAAATANASTATRAHDDGAWLHL